MKHLQLPNLCGQPIETRYSRFKSSCSMAMIFPRAVEKIPRMGASMTREGYEDGEGSGDCALQTYTYSTGEHYEGGWENNKREGKGTYFYSNGDVYSGLWHKNLKSSFGVYIKANHIETYSGEWRGNCRNGRGCLIQRNGTRYIGSFKQDLRHGAGVSIRRSGHVHAEIWRHGQIVHRKPLFSCSESDLIISHRFKIASSEDEEEPTVGAAVGILDSDRSENALSSRVKHRKRATLIDAESSLIMTEQPVPAETEIGESPAERSHVSRSLDWSVEDVDILLKFAGLGSLCPTFTLEQVDGFALLSLVQSDTSVLEQVGLEQGSNDLKILMCLLRVIVKMRHKVQAMESMSLEAVSDCFKELEINYEEIDFDFECGRGGYGKVYRANWCDRVVACKVFRTKEGTPLNQLSKDFWQELNALAKLRHPNITLLLGVCLQPRYCIVTEFVPCGALFDLIHRRGDLPNWGVARIIGLAKEICLGMAYLHSQKVLHCDLKSSNLLVTETWGVKIADFGLSFLFNEQDVFDNIKVPLGCVGTHHWIAPEVLRGEEYSEGADVYSFGTILWEMIHRKIPFQDLTAAQVIGIVGYGGKRLQISSYCPPHLSGIIRRCLVRDNSELRPAFHQLVQDLDSLHRLAVLEVEDSLDAFFGRSGDQDDGPGIEFSLSNPKNELPERASEIHS